MVQLKQNNWANLAVQSWRGSHGCGAIDGDDIHNFICLLRHFFIDVSYFYWVTHHSFPLPIKKKVICSMYHSSIEFYTKNMGKMGPTYKI